MVPNTRSQIQRVLLSVFSLEGCKQYVEWIFVICFRQQQHNRMKVLSWVIMSEALKLCSFHISGAARAAHEVIQSATKTRASHQADRLTVSENAQGKVCFDQHMSSLRCTLPLKACQNWGASYPLAPNLNAAADAN